MVFLLLVSVLPVTEQVAPSARAQTSNPPVNSSDVAFGGTITAVQTCMCPFGFLLTISGFNGGFFFVDPGDIKVYPYGQYLRVSPLVLGSASRENSVRCGNFGSLGCVLGDSGKKIKTIASFLPH